MTRYAGVFEMDLFTRIVQSGNLEKKSMGDTF